MSADCQEDPHHPLVGQTFGGKFRIVSLLSRGAHGLVFKAVQAGIDREVALKMLRPDVGADRAAEFRERFLREARLAGQLQHPNIVTVYDYGEAPGDSCFIALELLRGQTLHDVLLSGPLPVRRALPIFTQLCHALIHAHEHGILHRDIKPSNVFVSERDFVKLFDFGLVKPELPHEEITDEGTFMGTPHYAAPEQIRGAMCDARIDLYALGVLMYRALAGRLPFRGTSWVSVVLQHLEEPYPPIASVSPDVDVPRDVEAIIERCLHKDPAQRFANGRELLEALERQIQVLDQRAYERTFLGAPPPGVVESFEPEPTQDDGTLETGDMAPLTPLATPIPTAPLRARRDDPHPAVFAIACLAVGLIVLLVFATRPGAESIPAAPESSAVAASAVGDEALTTDIEVTEVEVPVSGRRETAAPSTASSEIAEAPASQDATARSKPSRPVSASKVDATIATSRTPTFVDAAAWTGVWRGRARGRAIAFDLSVRADGTILGTLERRIGDVTQTHPVQGTVTAGGVIQLLDPTERDGTIYSGSISGGAAEGDVMSGGKSRGSWSVAIE